MTHSLVDPVQPTKFGRDQLVTRAVVAFASAAEVAGFDASLGAATTTAIVVDGILFELDQSDLTSAADGVWVVVSADGRRYKAAPSSNRVIDVQSTSLATPPLLSAANWGLAWLVPAAATGAWAASADHVAISSPRGWVFVPPRVGALVYDRTTDGYRRYSVAGAWSPGAGSPAEGSVTPETMELPFGLVAVSRIVTAPPTIPLGTSVYIIPSGATGDWAARMGQIAIGRRDGTGTTWSYLAPPISSRVWCLAEGMDLQFGAGGWAPVAAALSTLQTTADDAALTLSGNSYTYGATAPTLAATAAAGLGLIHAARAAGNLLRLRCRFVTSLTAADIGTVALFSDSSAVAVQWLPVSIGATAHTYSVEFVVSAVDVDAHTYSIRFGANLGSPSRRLLTLEEASA